MSKYLVQVSKKNGLFEPFDEQKYYIMSPERLSKMLLQPVLWVVWSAKWINLEFNPLEDLQGIYGNIEMLD